MLACGVVAAGVAAPTQATPLTQTVTSPDSEIELTVEEQHDGSLVYSVTAGETTIFEESPMGIATEEADLTSGLELVRSSRRSIDETYSLPAGTHPSYRDHANELVLEFEKDGVVLELVLRAYDDGVAYRYRLPGEGQAVIAEENSGFQLPPGTGGWAAPWNANYEQDYLSREADELDAGEEFTMPLLASIDDDAYFALLTEAHGYNTDASYAPALLQGDGAGTGLLNVTRTPDEDFPISTTYPFQTPWRVAIVAPDLDVLYNSALVQHLNPAADQDADWVRPGRAAWSWYTDEQSASDLEKQKQMVDFAASMGWEYVTVDCCYTPEEDLPAIAEYAQQRGVEIFAWVTAEAFSTPELAGPLAEAHSDYGVAGLKVDFFLSDSQEVQGWYQAVAEAAGEHELMLNLHGATKPGGENRTWPWILTTEAVAGTEHYRYPPPTTARLDVTLPFTRGPLGSMDYTPTMISQNDAILTQGHTLAQSIVFSSAMINYADSAAAYEQFPGRHLMRAVPAVWDESQVVEGYPGSHITIARRSGEEWFIGAMTDQARTAEVPLDFLGQGRYTATIFSDDSDGRVEVTTEEVTRMTTLSLPMLETGGVSVHLATTPLDQIGSDDTRYEAEDPSNGIGGGANIEPCHGCSGGAKVGYLGDGGWVEFTDVTASSAGTHEVTFSYTSGDPRDIRLSVNGEEHSLEELPTSGGWEFLNKWTVQVELEEGQNTIRFDNPTEHGPDIDSLVVTRATEAEDTANRLGGDAVIDSCLECSDGALVRGLDGNGSLEITDLTVAQRGDHTVRIDYASEHDASIEVAVDGVSEVVDLPATGDAGALASATIGLALGSEGSTVRISDASSAGVGIDRLVATR